MTIIAQGNEATESQRLEAALGALNRLLSHKNDTLFHFVLEAAPYVTNDDAERLKFVQRVARNHHNQAEALARVINALDGVPNPLGHDIGVADLNYLSLEYLMTELKEYQEHVLEETRETLDLLGAWPAALDVVEDILATDERDLEKLEGLM